MAVTLNPHDVFIVYDPQTRLTYEFPNNSNVLRHSIAKIELSLHVEELKVVVALVEKEIDLAAVATMDVEVVVVIQTFVTHSQH
jgi:hypothetical protein